MDNTTKTYDTDIDGRRYATEALGNMGEKAVWKKRILTCKDESFLALVEKRKRQFHVKIFRDGDFLRVFCFKRRNKAIKLACRCLSTLQRQAWYLTMCLVDFKVSDAS